MDERYILLHQAISEIAARCDGAETQDGVGFNGHDTKFGKRAAAMPPETWNDTLAAEVARILPIYRGQLENYGIDYPALKSVIDSFSEHADNRHDARDIARQAEYQRKNAPYIFIEGNIVGVKNSFPIKDDLKRNGFKYDPRRLNNKAWESPLNGQAAATIIGMGISLSDEQKAILDAQEITPTEPGQYAATKTNLDVCSLHPEHLQLDTDFGTIPLAITRALPGRKWDGIRKVNCVSPHIGLYVVAQEYNLTISDRARTLIESHREEQEAEQAAKKAIVSESFATETDQDVAIQDNLYPFQRAGAAYAVNHIKDGQGVIIGDEMGLGKTRQALSVLETKSAYPALIVCPPSLTLNWKREIEALLPHRSVAVYKGRGTGCFMDDSDIHVLGYSVAETYIDSLPMLNGLVLDESQYVKNDKAKRTRALMTLSGHGYKEVEREHRKVKVPIPGKMNPDCVILETSGTPILNRPKELVSQLVIAGRLNPLTKGEGSVSWFLYRYCGPERSAWGTTFNGATNLEELHQWLRSTCYVRREKIDVLTELPPKIRAPQFIEMDTDARDLYERLADEGAERAANSRAEALVYLNALRHAVGTAKTRIAVEWAHDFLEASDKSLIIFADHKNVQRGIISGLRDLGHDVVHILGGQSTQDTENAKAIFQAKQARVILVSLMAGNMGHTLTAASDVLMVQQGWNPGTQDQAEDRSHRIGQDVPVTAWYLIAQDTIDDDLYEIVEGKRKVVRVVNSGITVEMDEESIFNEVLERTLARHGGGKPRFAPKADAPVDREEKVTTCKGCGEINLCTAFPDDLWYCSECIPELSE